MNESISDESSGFVVYYYEKGNRNEFKTVYRDTEEEAIKYAKKRAAAEGIKDFDYDVKEI